MQFKTILFRRRQASCSNERRPGYQGRVRKPRGDKERLFDLDGSVTWVMTAPEALLRTWVSNCITWHYRSTKEFQPSSLIRDEIWLRKLIECWVLLEVTDSDRTKTISNLAMHAVSRLSVRSEWQNVNPHKMQFSQELRLTTEISDSSVLFVSIYDSLNSVSPSL